MGHTMKYLPVIFFQQGKTARLIISELVFTLLTVGFQQKRSLHKVLNWS